MEPVKVVFGFLKKIERLFGKRKNGPLSRGGGKSSVQCHGSSREPGKWTARYGRKDDLRRTGRITIQDSLDSVPLHSQEILCLRLPTLHPSTSRGLFLCPRRS